MVTESKTKDNKPHPKVPADLQPGRVLVTLDDEIDNFEEEVLQHRSDGGDGTDHFIPFRLSHGIYGQRQENTQMVRVKLPYGGVHSRPDGRLCHACCQVLRIGTRAYNHKGKLSIPFSYPSMTCPT